MSEQRSELIKLFGNLHNAVNENPWNQMKVSGCLLDITAKFDYDDAKFKSLEAKNVELEKKLEIAMEALEKIAWDSNNDERIDWDTAREALDSLYRKQSIIDSF